MGLIDHAMLSKRMARRISPAGLPGDVPTHRRFFAGGGDEFRRDAGRADPERACAASYGAR